MKKITVLILSLIFLISFTGCGPDTSNTPDGGEVSSSGEAAVAPQNNQDGGSSAEPENTAENIDVSYTSNHCNMSVSLPEGWEYEIYEDPALTDESCLLTGEPFGISFWPSDRPEMVTRLRYNPNRLGICGTGVTFEDITFSSGLTATKCTEGYQDGSHWCLIIFSDTPGSYSAEFNVNGSWKEYEQEVLEILDTAELGKGMISESEAIAAAEKECTAEHDGARADFDYITGKWTVEFMLNYTSVDGGKFII